VRASGPDEQEVLLKVPGLSDQIAKLNSSAASSAENSERANAMFAERPGPYPRQRQFIPWQAFLPYALAYLGVGGYVLAYSYLRGYYSSTLPGIPIGFPYLDTMRVLIGAPFVFLIFAASPALFIIAEATSMTSRTRRTFLDALPLIDSAARHLRDSRAALVEIERILREVGTEGEADSYPDIEEARQTLADRDKDLADLRRQMLRLVGVFWRLPYRIAVMSPTLRGGLALSIPAVLLVPGLLIVLADHVEAFWLLSICRYSVGLSLLLGFAVIITAWRTIGLTLTRLPSVATGQRLCLALFGAVFLLVVALAGGIANGYSDVASGGLWTVTVTLQDGSAARGSVVRVESSPNFYLVTKSTRDSTVVRIITPSQMQTVRAEHL